MRIRVRASLGALLSSSFFSLTVWAQDLGSLKNVTIPRPPELDQYISDHAALVVLGKSLFWDMQLGSDGRVACATCHFHAGADHRARNQLVNLRDTFPVNHALAMEDFPFRLLSDVNDNRSLVLRDTSAITGSSGLLRRMFVDVAPGVAQDDGFDTGDAPMFSLNGSNTRRVTTRNSPSVVNSVFYVRNFWDGRARDIFTGVTPFGESDQRLNAVVLRSGRLEPERVRLSNASLASQAVGPPLNDVEMSYSGRIWPKLGKKMLSLRPLALQRVAIDDSVLGPSALAGERGLVYETYFDLVRAAFKPDYWNSRSLLDAQGRTTAATAPAQNTGEFTQAEYNFALFFGLALQAYQATLISDDAPFDRFSEGISDALTPEAQRGLRVFRNNAGCTNCHVGPEFSAAAITSIARRGLTERRGNAERDTGFFRIGVRPINEDLGIGADDDLGQPLSIAASLRAESRAANEGAFKTPILRNVEFTGPYFHTGGQATLRQVVDFYARGGDFPDGGNLGPGIRRRNLSTDDREALVAFLRSLSDDRVQYERAPFDHPELCVPSGHSEPLVRDSDHRFSLSAVDRWLSVPPVGRLGNTVPLQTFDELLLGVGADGSRAHNMTTACTIPELAPK